MGSGPDPERSPGRSVTGQLGFFAVTLVLPVLLFAGVVLWRYALAERARIEVDAAEVASAVSTAVDRELTGIFAALDILAASTSLQSGNFAAFRLEADALLRRQGMIVLVTDPDGQQLLNARLPSGAPLPRSHLDLDPDKLRAGRPFASGLVVGQVTGMPQFLAVTPVEIAGERRALLMIATSVSRLDEVLRSVEAPGNVTVAVVDGAGVIMARSVGGAAFVGRRASQDLIDNTTGRRGTWNGTTVDGTPIFGSYARSRISGYVCAVGIRLADLNRPIWRSLSLFGVLFVLLGVLSTLLALVVARRITGPIAALSRSAARLGRGEPVERLSTGLAEANGVGEVLADASGRLRAREADLREANGELQRFAYIVSHDLRSPLVNIMGFTAEIEALRTDIFDRLRALRPAGEAGSDDDGDLGAEFDEALGFIKTSTAKMDRLINAILALSREGRRVFEPERVDMNELLAGIRASLAAQIATAHATVVVAPLPAIESDRLALEQVFSNLLDNAVKYLRADAPGRVEVVAEARSRSIVFRVADNGRGIDARDAERVFDLFRRSGVQDRPGEGIGLAHVRALVRRLGGSIALTSRPGMGSTFAVTLPRRWVGEGGSGKAA